ncbi:MAG: ABC transporter ATP-binding protein [Candidatus Dormibacteria bacterium]
MIRPVIDAAGLGKAYGGFRAVNSIDLRVERGELFGFLGPNGAGKTTTIKMLVGLLRPTSGRASIAGFDIVTEARRAKAHLGYVPDSAMLYEKLSAREFLDFSGELYEVEGDARRRRIEALLELFELADRGDELLAGYSRGMRQKVSLAAALLHEPDVLFLDEPTVGLDPRSARVMKDVLRDRCRTGHTVFLSTHILEIAERICDRVGIIDGGRLVAVGTVAELRQEADQSLEQVFLQLTGNADADVSELLSELAR